MLKKIPVDQLRPGMFLAKIEGSWFQPPFWTSNFLLGEAEVGALRASDVAEVWIDTEQGAGVEADAGVPSVPAPAPVEPAPPLPPMPASGARALRDELPRAADLLERTRVAVTGLFDDARLGKAVDLALSADLAEEITACVDSSQAALISVARLKSADEYTYLHSVAVSALMYALAKHMGLERARQKDLALAGLLHDIGKSAIPSQILHKPSLLAPEEFSVVRTHPTRGADILRASGVNSEVVIDVCLHHHERMDGGGYPHGLAGADVSQAARMSAVCDVYDALTSIRPYKDAWAAVDTLAGMYQMGGQFDPAVLSSFIHTVGIYPVGTLVRLASGPLAVVVASNPAALLRPRLRLFFDSAQRRPIPARELDLACCDDQIAGHEDPLQWGWNDWERRWRDLV